MALINLNDAIPASPTGETNIKWQADALSPRNVSAYVPIFIGDNPASPLATPESGAVPAPATGDAAAGKFLKADGTWEVPVSFADNETPAGALNGSNTTFTLAHTPIAPSLMLFVNGVLLLQGTDYTSAGAVVTLTLLAPNGANNEWIKAWYRY
jgi:hypothetical protein